MLADAARGVASPQIRNTGTMGGNVSQDARCLRTTATACPAIAPAATPASPTRRKGVNREHALFDSDRCIAVSPSDTAPALVALDAKMSCAARRASGWSAPRNSSSARKIDITQMTSVEPDELLVAIRIPTAWAGAASTSRRSADRQTWDFPLVNVAAAIVVKNGIIERARLACGGVSAVPRRLTEVEAVLLGKAPSEALGREAGAAPLAARAPLNYNGYKIPLMANLVMRAVRDATGGAGDD